MMTDPPIVANQNLTEGVIFYEWWLTSHIFVDQNLTENFKFRI